MIVEFIGSTGAGKTTLVKQVLHNCEREGIHAVVGTDFVLNLSQLNWIQSRLIRVIFVNLISLVASLAAWRSNLPFYRFALRILLHLPREVAWLQRLFLAKNILKRIGICEVIRRYGNEEQIYLVDEGTLHIAHNLFVHVAVEADRRDLATFARLVRLPEVVVYLRQDKVVLIERILARGHARVPHYSFADAACFVQQALNVFDELVQNPAIQQRVVVVDGARKIVEALDSCSSPLQSNIARLVEAGLHVSAENVSI